MRSALPLAGNKFVYHFELAIRSVGFYPEPSSNHTTMSPDAVGPSVPLLPYSWTQGFVIKPSLSHTKTGRRIVWPHMTV